MSRRIATHLLDENHNRIADLDVDVDHDLYVGKIVMRRIPVQLLDLFTEFEDAVENQTFRRVDELAEKIHRENIRVLFDDEKVESLEDLQIYPSSNMVSFRVVAS